jgi:hypothetical protein
MADDDEQPDLRDRSRERPGAPSTRAISEPASKDITAEAAELGPWARLRADRRLLTPALIAAFATYAYFVGPPAWNQNSRLALTRALVERGELTIDPDHFTTGDKSRRGDHFYSDKAPGASLLAVPAYAVYHGLRQLVGGEAPRAYITPLDPAAARRGDELDPEARLPGDRLSYNQQFRLALYLSRLFSTSLLALAGVAALYLLALRQLAGDRLAALTCALTYGLATPALVYGAAFYGHQPCADLLLLALAAITLSQRTEGRPAAPLFAGLCLGLAVLCEYPAAVPVALLAALALWRRGPRFTAWLLLGGLPCALLLGLYHLLAFGHPLKTGYDFVYLAEFAAGMQVNYGIHAPDPAVLLQLLFGSYRGLFYLAPVLLLAAWGLAAELRRPADPERRAVAVAAAAIVAFYLSLNSGYYMWDGGAALGPRHCVPMLPFLALGLAPALRAAPRLFNGLALLSAAAMLLAAAAAPEAPQHGNPLWGHAWPRLRDAAPGTYVGPQNLGLFLGLPGLWSLTPLLVLWLWVSAELRAAARALSRP